MKIRMFFVTSVAGMATADADDAIQAFIFYGRNQLESFLGPNETEQTRALRAGAESAGLPATSTAPMITVHGSAAKTFEAMCVTAAESAGPLGHVIGTDKERRERTRFVSFLFPPPTSAVDSAIIGYLDDERVYRVYVCYAKDQFTDVLRRIGNDHVAAGRINDVRKAIRRCSLPDSSPRQMIVIIGAVAEILCQSPLMHDASDRPSKSN